MNRGAHMHDSLVIGFATIDKKSYRLILFSFGFFAASINNRQDTKIINIGCVGQNHDESECHAPSIHSNRTNFNGEIKSANADFFNSKNQLTANIQTSGDMNAKRMNDSHCEKTIMTKNVSISHKSVGDSIKIRIKIVKSVK